MSDREDINDLIDDIFGPPPTIPPKPSIDDFSPVLVPKIIPNSSSSLFDSDDDDLAIEAEIVQQSSVKAKNDSPLKQKPNETSTLIENKKQRREVPTLVTPEKQTETVVSKTPPSPMIKASSSDTISPLPTQNVSPKKSTGKRRTGRSFLKSSLRAISKNKKKKSEPISPVVEVDHKESVLSLQQIALQLYKLQEQCNSKRKQLFDILIKAHKSTDNITKKELFNKADTLFDEILNNDLLMANYEHNLEINDSLSVSQFDKNASFERLAEQQKIDVKTNFRADITVPTLIHSKNELPQDVIEHLLEAGIQPLWMDKHFKELLAVIRISDKYNFITPEQEELWYSIRIGQLILPNYSRITKPLEHFLTDEKLAINPKRRYKFFGSEGKGGFGQVYFAKNKKTGKQVAIKKQKPTSKKQRRQCANEISYLHFCNHQNIVGFENVYQVGEELWISMDYLDGGTITGALQQKKFKETHIAYITDQILLGLKYLHGHHIVHNDLKGENIMLTEIGEVIIVDLGLCVDIDEFNPAVRGGGTSAFMAPEAITESCVTTASDIWSLGITLLQMANGVAPYRDNHILGMFKVATKNLESVDGLLNDPDKWSSSFKNFIKLCLDPNYKTRPTAEYLLGHIWFAEQITEESQDDIMHLVQYCWTRNTAAVF